MAALLASTHVMAQESCTDKSDCWPGGSAMAEGLDAADQLNQTTAVLNRKNRELLRLVGVFAGERMTKGLMALNVEWIRYREAECELVGNLTNSGGSWPSTYAVRCELNMTDQRLRHVRSAIRCIARIPADHRPLDAADCMQQLAPLANLRPAERRTQKNPGS
jgi:uncharacterized protein YecT (DUF1311 family)